MNAGRLADEPVPARTLSCFLFSYASQIHTHPIRRMSLSLSIFHRPRPMAMRRVSPPHLLSVCLCTARAQPSGRDNCEGLDRSGRRYVASRGASQTSALLPPFLWLVVGASTAPLHTPRAALVPARLASTLSKARVSRLSGPACSPRLKHLTSRANPPPASDSLNKYPLSRHFLTSPSPPPALPLPPCCNPLPSTDL